MSTTSADLSRLSFGKLGVGDVLPANPAMLVARFTSESLQFQPNVVASPELDPSGQVRDSILTGASSTGNVEFPLVRSPWFHEIMAAAFRNEWGTGVLGYPDPANVGQFLTRNLAPNELIPGKLVKLYDVEKRFETPDVPSYQVYRKAGVNSLSLSVSPNEMLTGSLSLIAGELDLYNADLAGATYPDPGQYTPLTAPNVTEVNIGAMTAAACFSALTLSFGSNMRAIDCIGSYSAREKAIGRFEPMIEGTTYFVSNDIIQALIDQDSFPVTIELGDGDGNLYKFFYPRCKFTNATSAIPGTNQDVMLPVSIRALYDPNYRYSCKVDRTLA